MALTPITKRVVTDDVFDQLFAEVLDGSLGAGDPIPSERRLAELLGVSRPAVREALGRLSAAGLVEVRHGGSTTVRDFQRHAGLDLLPRLLVRDGELDPAIARSIIEARFAVAPQIAGLAAGRAPGATQEARTSLSAALEPLAAAAADPVARQRAALAFWDAVVDLADSIVFRLLFNNLRQAYEPAIEALAPLLEGEVSDLAGYQRIADAVLTGDATSAVRTATEFLRPATEAMVGFLDALQRLPEDGGNP